MRVARAAWPSVGNRESGIGNRARDRSPRWAPRSWRLPMGVVPRDCVFDSRFPPPGSPGPADSRCSRKRNLCNFPVSVLGSFSTNSIRRGYLYGAISAFTKSCSSRASSGVAAHPGAHDNECLHDVTAVLVRRGDDAALLHRAMLQQHVLDLRARHVVSARNDHVVRARDVPEVALVVLTERVAGDVPAVLDVAALTLEIARGSGSRSDRGPRADRSRHAVPRSRSRRRNVPRTRAPRDPSIPGECRRRWPR